MGGSSKALFLCNFVQNYFRSKPYLSKADFVQRRFGQSLFLVKKMNQMVVNSNRLKVRQRRRTFLFSG